MYQEHFHLNENPFSLTPDTQFFFRAQPYQEALETITYCLDQNEGFIKITGPVGSGKTLLCRQLLNQLDERFVVAYIPNPTLSDIDLYKMIIHELKAETTHLNNMFETQKQLNNLLLELSAKNKRVVLIIDEAQTMSDETLEAVRLLTNLETEKTKLLQVILFGQEELDEKLNSPRFRQLRERIVFSYYLRPLNQKELKLYVSHRIGEASLQYQELFSNSALQKIYKASRGLPRIINILCHKSLIVAYADSKRLVDKKHAKKAIVDTFGKNKNALKNETIHNKLSPFIEYGFLMVLFSLLIGEIIWLGVTKL